MQAHRVDDALCGSGSRAQRHSSFCLRLLGLAAVLVLTSTSAVTAQTKPPEKAPAAGAKPAPKPQAAPAEKPAPQANAAPAISDNAKLAILIQNTLIAVNQANLTGNYSVLRDLASPGFQSVNSPAQLAETFADLRKRAIDLSPIVLFQPKLVRPAAIDDKGSLRLVGFYDTRPEQVQFELLFTLAGGQWRLNGLGVRTLPAPPATDEAKEPKAAPTR